MVSLAEGDLARMKHLLEVNLMGTMAVNRVFYPLLAKEGRILIVTSEVATLAPLPFNGLYSVSKAALDAYAQALRQEMNLLGQRVITIRPGAIETPLAKGSMADTEALAAQTVLFQRGADRFSRIAQKFMGRPMKAEVLARLICRAALANHPRLIYHKHRNVGLVLLGALPIRLQCAVIKLLLR
jgi:NAD(P)-dependent dehydrogenase (short-subunit alcohol dehydrogenase family)